MPWGENKETNEKQAAVTKNKNDTQKQREDRGLKKAIHRAEANSVARATSTREARNPPRRMGVHGFKGATKCGHGQHITQQT